MNLTIRLELLWLAVCGLSLAFGGSGVGAQEPTDLTAAQIGQGRVQLTWVNPQSYDGLRLFRDGAFLADLPGTATSYLDGDAPLGSRVYALRPCGPDCPETPELGTHVVKIYLDGATSPAAILDVTAGNGSEADTSYLGLGAGATPQSGALDVDFLRVALGEIAPADETYGPPEGGWAYAYEADAGQDVFDPAASSLDGTWNHDNGSDAWDGSALGGELSQANQPGGAMVVTDGEASYLRIQDPGDPRDYAFGGADPSNRKVYWYRDLAPQGAAATVLDDGVTLYFRSRVPTDGAIDPLYPDGGGGSTPYPAGGDGYVIHDGGKGGIGIKQAAGGIVSFSLATEAESGAGALLLNNLNGDSASGNVDTGEGGTASAVPLDSTAWHDVWATISSGTGSTGPSVTIDVLEFAPPVNLACVQNGSNVDLSWENPSTYSALRIFRNGELLVEIAGDSTSYSDASAPVGQNAYQVIPCLGGQCPETLELGTHVLKIYLDGDTSPAAILDVTAGIGNDYAATSYLALGGGSTDQSGALDVDFIRVAFEDGAPADASYPAPGDGWAYAYEAAVGEDLPGDGSGNNALDGTWNHDNGSDAWDGSAVGGEPSGTNNPGGAGIVEGGDATFLRFQDPGDPRDYGLGDPSNRKVYFGHNLASDGAGDRMLDDGVSLYFRVRLPTDTPIDSLHPDGGGGITAYPAGGDGYVIHNEGKGSIGVCQASGGIISFSLTTEAESGFGGILMNALNGSTPADEVDTGQGVANELVLDPTQWHDIWVSISSGTGLTGPSCSLQVCPVEGDTECTGLELVQIEGTTNVQATATAQDASGDTLSYTFSATNGVDDPIVVGPQAENVATLELAEGEWTVSVTIDDDPTCDDPPGTCSATIDVQLGGLQKPGDANQDGTLDLSDPVAVLNHLFLGTLPELPCGDGTVLDSANQALLDANGDGAVDLSDSVWTLSFLFLGGPRPVACLDDTCPCVRIPGCPDNAGTGECP